MNKAKAMPGVSVIYAGNGKSITSNAATLKRVERPDPFLLHLKE